MTLAWHLVGDTLRDGRPIPADGEWLEHTGKLIMCETGLHASERLIDALIFAPGNVICRVELAGTIENQGHTDKFVASRRRILWRVDGSKLLRDFARWAALQVIDQWEAPEVVVQWLETGDNNLRNAARSAAQSAARSAAESAAESAAWSEALSAARSAADSAARGAAWSAAWNAARSVADSAAESAAWNAAWSAQNNKLIEMVETAHRKERER